MDIISVIQNLDEAMENLTLKLINKKSNEELLKKVPYKNFLDLAAIVILRLDDRGRTYTLTVDHALLQYWNVDLKKIYRRAVINLASERHVLMSSEDVFRGLTGTFGFEDIIHMYVLTNKSNQYGAAHMMNEDIFRNFSDEYSTDIFVIPSSVHELILLPIDKMITADEITKMVRQVNEAEVVPEERLSDHTYVYKREGGWSW